MLGCLMKIEYINKDRYVIFWFNCVMNVANTIPHYKVFYAFLFSVCQTILAILLTCYHAGHRLKADAKKEICTTLNFRMNRFRMQNY